MTQQRTRPSAPDLVTDPEVVADPSPPPGRPRWWVEVLVIAAFYTVYSVIRDIHGATPVSEARALANARRVIDLERSIGVFHEAQFQHLVLDHARLLIEVLDVWYGTTHFVVTAAVLAVLFFRHTERYRLWRNTLAIATALALVGFAFFPMLPPRLLPASYGFVDTLRTVGGLWSFNSGPIADLSNQYAAMPSLHLEWSLWCALAGAAILRRRWARVAVFAYPLVMLVCVIATANHFFADCVAGVAVDGVAYGLARLVTRPPRSGRRPEPGPQRRPVADLTASIESLAPSPAGGPTGGPAAAI